jgi:hypothetical protein
MSDLFILIAGIGLGQVIRINVSPEHLALGTRAIQKAIAQLPAVERGIYRILDSLGITSPTKRLDAYFEQLAQDGTIELEDVPPTAEEVKSANPESRAARAALTSPKTKIG